MKGNDVLPRKYSTGRYIDEHPSRLRDELSRIVEYLGGVTLARQDINRLKPKFVDSLDGDVLEIGGFDAHYKARYQRGRFINLDIAPSKHVDVIGNAEQLSMFTDESFGGVICISVLEHTPSPRSVIDESFRILKKGGKALFSSPWLFETHMEPQDYLRFSRHISDKWFSNFRVLDVHFTNSHFGLIAHVLQDQALLRAVLGTPFLIADRICAPSAKWATQISYILEKD